MFGWDAVDAVTVDSHEILAAAGHNVCLEAVGSKISHDLKHGLVNQFGVRPLETRVLRCRQPLLGCLLEYLGGHSSLGGSDDACPILLIELGHSCPVAREHGPEGLSGFPFRVLVGQSLHSVQFKYGLRVERMLHPQRAILVERGNPILRSNVIGVGFFGDGLNKLNNRLLGWRRHSTKTGDRSVPAPDRLLVVHRIISL